MSETRKAERRRFQFGVKKILLWTAVVALLCAGFRACALNPSRPRVLTDRTDFPPELTDLLEAADQEHIEVSSFNVLILPRGMRDDYYWQLDASPELIDLSTRLWQMKPTTEDSSPVQEFWQYWPSVWDRPGCRKPDFLTSSYWYLADWGVLVMHDKDHRRLYFWLICDF